MSKTSQTSNVKRQRFPKGFSLIEALISVFIFALAMAALMGTFSVFLKTYANGKRIQKDLENAQYAMNLMAKTLRTSTVLSASAFPLYTYDHSQGKCIRYNYSGSGDKLRVTTTTDAAPASISDCTWTNLNPYSDLTSDDIISARVAATPTAGDDLGRVTISLGVRDPGNPASAIPISIQTSVSLRQ